MDGWDCAECRENQVLDCDKTGNWWCGRRRRLPDHWTSMCGNCGGVKRLTQKRDMVNDGSDTKYQFCSELRLEVLVPQWGALTEWLAGETWRLNKSSHVNCVKIQLTVDSALCPVLKVLNPASELGTTENLENYSRPVSNDRSCHTQWMDNAVPWVKSAGKVTQNGERSSSFSAI